MSAAGANFLNIERARKIARRAPALYNLLKWIRYVALPAARKASANVLRIALSKGTKYGPANGVYSDAVDLRRSNCSQEGGVILEGQGSPQIIEPSMILMCGRRQHEFQPWPILWRRHFNARLVGPGLAHMNQQKSMCVEALYGREFYRDDPSYNYIVHNSPLPLSGRWTSLISRWCGVDRPQPYGHWILDALPRLALLEKFPADTRILVPPFKTRYQVESLTLLGLLERVRWTSEQHLLVEDYYFSSPTSMIVSYSPYAVDFLRAAFLPHARGSADTPKKFFVTRDTRLRNIVNRSEVEDFFRSIGWAICDTATMAFAEQVKHFADAEAICMIHGSAIQNAVWCSPNCRVIELFAADYLAGDGEWIAKCTKSDYSFLIFPSDADLSIRVQIPELRRHLRSLALM